MSVLLLLALLTQAAPLPGAAPAPAVPSASGVLAAELRGEALMGALRGGGYTVVLRHARTDRSFQERIDTVPKRRVDQRNLNDAGVRDARLMGAVLKKYGIPFGEIVASPMYRTVETAEYAAGTPVVSMALRVFPSTGEARALLTAQPKPGTNRLVVTHHFVIETHVPGIKPGDIGESEAVVVRPVKGAIEVVGRILLADWEALAGPGLGAASASGTANAAHAAHATLPETHLAVMARRYVDAFNSGDTTTMRAFIESALAPNPERTTEARLAGYLDSHRHLAPLVITGVRETAPGALTLGVRAKGGEYLLIARGADEHGARLQSISIGTTGRGHP